MTGPCPFVESTGEIAHFCQIGHYSGPFADAIDYLHSSPAALAVGMTALFAFIAYASKPILIGAYNRSNDRRRRRRLLKAFGLEVRHSAGQWGAAFPTDATGFWDERFEATRHEETPFVPFQTYAESDFMSSALRAELPQFPPQVAEFIVRYYATDAVLAAAIKDLRTDAYKTMSVDRRKAFFGNLIKTVRQQQETCASIIGEVWVSPPQGEQNQSATQEG